MQLCSLAAAVQWKRSSVARPFYLMLGLAIFLAAPAASWAQFQTQQPAPPRIRQQVIPQPPPQVQSTPPPVMQSAPPPVVQSAPPPPPPPPPIVDERGTEKSPLVVRTLKSNEDTGQRTSSASNIAIIALGGAVAILA